MKTAIRQRALELGFDACRVTTAEPPTTARQFQQWLRAGKQGTMSYLERTAGQRADPGQVLPGARAIIALAASYAPPEDKAPGAAIPAMPPANPPDPNLKSQNAAGLIARYARTNDYHDVLGERLRRLVLFVNALGGPGVRSLGYIDTGPVLERDLAQRAGLGFIGKHTNLISRQLGNWFFLAEILTTLPLEPDPPERHRCGSCARCLAACPTRALTAPFQLDARRCISYLTIEWKGSIPMELRLAIGNRIFGCDDCLAACPWNRFAREGRLMRQCRRSDLEEPDLIGWLALDEPAFQQRFAGTPMLRTRRRGFLRNVCVALGNTGDPAALPALWKARRDPEPLIAEHARWAVRQIEARRGVVPR